MNVALHNLKAALINGRANKAQEIEHARRTLAVLEGQYALFTDLLDRAEKEAKDESDRLAKKEVRTDGQRADEFDKLRNALEAAILHDIEKVLGKPDSRGA